jgi:CRISPR system Cascade subunit CasA
MSAFEPLTFSLIDQPWLTVRTERGTAEELSLTDVFGHAHTLTGLVGDVPTQVFASTRLLLAVLHRALGGSLDVDRWLELWKSPRLPLDTIGAYLEQHRDRFDLFHADTPFFQVAGLRTAKGEMSELDRLIADVPNGQPFFSTRIGGGITLGFAEATRWLVHAQAFDPSGIKSGAEGDARVKGGKGYPIGTGWSGLLGGVLPEGLTLKHTLLLNLIVRDSASEVASDRPVWERDPVGPGEEQPDGRAPTGPVDLYTWQSRRIRLAHDGSRVTHVLVCNGERNTPQNKHALETHTGWRRSKAQEKKLGAPLVYMPREHDAERAVWRGLQSLLPGAVTSQGGEAAAFLAPPVLNWISNISEDIGLDYPVRLRTVGMTYGSQSSTTEEIIDDSLPLRAKLLRQDATDLVGIVLACADAADKAAYTVGKLASDLAAAGGCGRDEREGPASRAKEHALAALDPPFREWVRTLGPDTDPTAAQIRWHETADDIVRGLGCAQVARAPLSAWSGRVVDKRLLTTSHADRNFRRKIRDVLGYAYLEPVA